MSSEKPMGEVLGEIREGVKSLAEGSKEIAARMKGVEERIGSVEEWKKSFAPNAISLPGCNDGKDKGRFSLVRAALGIATNWTLDGCEFERDIFKETAKKRALSAGVDSAGGYVVPVEYIAELIEFLRAESVVTQAGARQMTFTGSPVVIPRQTSAATVSSTAENAAISFTDQAFGEINLTPKMLSAGTKLSRRSAALSSPGLEQIVRTDLALQMALDADLKALRGTGASNQPLGVANTAGINTVALGANGGPVSYDLLVDMEGQLEDDNALRGSLAFIFHPKIRRKFGKLKDNENRPLFDREAQARGVTRTLIGYPFFTTTQLPTNLTKGSGTNLSEVYFANWSELIWGQWGNLVLESSTQAGDSSGGAFSSHQIWIKAVQEYDTAVRHVESFCLTSDAESA